VTCGGAGQAAVLGGLRCWAGCGAGQAAVLGGLRCWAGCGAGQAAVLGRLRCRLQRSAVLRSLRFSRINTRRLSASVPRD